MSAVMFNTIKVADALPSQRKDGKKLSKQQQLKAAEEQAAAAAELGESAGGQAALEGKSWDKMTKMAKGERILDNPALLKKSIKRDAKLKEKKQELWKTRVNSQKQAMSEKQSKRTGNLKKRVDEKKEKKIKKRENKLMRAGFEGRKSTPIG